MRQILNRIGKKDRTDKIRYVSEAEPYIFNLFHGEGNGNYRALIQKSSGVIIQLQRENVHDEIHFPFLILASERSGEVMLNDYLPGKSQ